MPSYFIPKPEVVSRRITNTGRLSLAEQMGLADSPADIDIYFDIVNTVGTLCDKLIPYDRIMPPEGEVRSAFIEEVKRRHTIIKRYKDAWPVLTMIRQHRQLRRAGSPRGIIRSPSDIASSKYRIRSRDATSKTDHRPKKGARPYVQLRCTNQQNNTIRKEPDSDEDALTDSSELPRGYQRPAGTVVHFLSSLAQDLSFLFPVFVRHGVRDELSLRSMLKMEDWRLWLYSWVREGSLTELQFRMVTDGLKNID